MLPAETGWTVTLPAAPSADAALDDLQIYIPLADGTLVAVDRQTGNTRWTAPTPGTTTPAAMADLVLVAGPERLVAVDRATGAPRWAAAGSFGRLLAAGSLVVATSTPQPGATTIAVSARRPADGQVAWTRQVVDGGDVRGLVADDATIVVAFAGGRVVALNRHDGAQRWVRVLPGDVTAPVLARDRVFVGSTDNSFTALDAASGQVAWRVRTGGDVVSLATDGVYVFIAALDNVLRAVNRSNGHQRWKQPLSTRPLPGLVVAGESLLLPGLAPVMSNFDARTGAPRGTFSPPGDTALQGPPLMDTAPRPFRVSLLAVLRDGRVLGLRPTELMFREAAGTLPQEVLGRPLTREAPPAAIRREPRPNAR